MIDMVISDELIEKLASSNPQIIHAHWIKSPFGDVSITCSNCNFHMCIAESVIPKMIYCPNCGAKMDEEWK